MDLQFDGWRIRVVPCCFLVAMLSGIINSVCFVSFFISRFQQSADLLNGIELRGVLTFQPQSCHRESLEAREDRMTYRSHIM